MRGGGPPHGEGPGRGLYAAGGCGRDASGHQGRGVNKGLRGGPRAGGKGSGSRGWRGPERPLLSGAFPLGSGPSCALSSLCFAGTRTPFSRPRGIPTLLSVPCASCGDPEMPDGLHLSPKTVRAPLWRPFPRRDPLPASHGRGPPELRDALFLPARRTCGSLAGVGGARGGGRGDLPPGSGRPEAQTGRTEPCLELAGGWGQIRPGTGDQIPAAPPRSGQPTGGPEWPA